jgi:hypothetical protein
MQTKMFPLDLLRHCNGCQEFITFGSRNLNRVLFFSLSTPPSQYARSFLEYVLVIWE